MKTQEVQIEWQPIDELKKLLNRCDFIASLLAYCPIEDEVVYITDAAIEGGNIIGYYGVGREEYYNLSYENTFSHFAIVKINKPEQKYE